MASAVQINPSVNGNILLAQPSAPPTDPGSNVTEPFSMKEAIYLADLCRTALNTYFTELSGIVDHAKAYTADEILALPLDKYHIPDALGELPSRRSSRSELAVALAHLLNPVHEGSLAALIRYNSDRVRLRAWAVLQRRFQMLKATQKNGRSTHVMTGGASPGVQSPAWASRIIAQGPWGPANKAVSVDGVKAIPMPVQIAAEEDLAPFLDHLKNDGTYEAAGVVGAVKLDEGKGEPHYGVAGAEFRKGVVYSDGRMDLCKRVVGPDHICRLMDSLKTNSFVKHFLLGNNIIGPAGARAIADFIREFPDRMDTWYLAGNCIDGKSFRIFVDAAVTSTAVTNIWLKRNPLGPGAAHDVFRLITETKNLETLDLDQTELGDQGVAHLFQRLASYSAPEGGKLPLRQIYLNGSGISVAGARAIASFLASPSCGISSFYMSCNPLGDEGVQALASAMPKAPYLTRLFLQSVGVSTKGAIELCKALTGHGGIRSVDLGQAYATEDLGQAYNYIEDDAVPIMAKFLTGTPELEFFNLGHCAITPPGLLQLTPAVLETKSLLYYFAASVLPDPNRQAPRFTPGVDVTMENPAARSSEHIKAEKSIKEHLESHIRVRFGSELSFSEFVQDEKRWLVNDKSIRKIDSVYRNRDAGLARRHLVTLVKDWKEGDDTLDRIMKDYNGAPSCSLKRRPQGVM